MTNASFAVTSQMVQAQSEVCRLVTAANRAAHTLERLHVAARDT